MDRLKKLCIVSSFFSASLLAPLSHAASFNLMSSGNVVSVGDSFTVELHMDFSDEATLGGGLDISYDGALASFQSFSFDASFLALQDPLVTCPGPDAFCSPLDQPNNVENITFGNFAGVGGVFLVGTLVFEAISDGALNLQTASTIGTGGPFVSAQTYGPMAVSFGGTSIEIADVPLPAAAWLFGSALIGLSTLRRNK